MNLTLEQFVFLAQKYNVIPLYDTLPADLDTPVSAFLKIRRDENDFLLESVIGGEKWGRYSFLGTQPRKIFRLMNGVLQAISPQGGFDVLAFQGNPFEVLRREFLQYTVHQDENLPRFFGGIVGYLAYDMVKYFDAVSLTKPADNQMPDLIFLQTDTVVIFDNLKQVMQIVHCAILDKSVAGDLQALQLLYSEAENKIKAVRSRLLGPLPAVSHRDFAARAVVKESFAEKAYCAMVERAKEYIAAGDIFQVVLSMRTVLERNGVDPFAVYRALRRINPSPYLYYLQFDGLGIVGASPEVLVRLEDDKIAVRPIAGTRKRGQNAQQDRALEQELKADPKELSEHIMLVDLGRNDVGRVAEIGSVRVDELKVVELYSHVMHLVSHVSGTLAADKDVFDVMAAAFPAGTLSGAPKIRAMEIIEELEPQARGIYGGAVGYVSFNHNMDFAIAIRTAVFKEDEIIVQAGAGIVHHSVAKKEYEECRNKAKAVLKAIESS